MVEGPQILGDATPSKSSKLPQFFSIYVFFCDVCFTCVYYAMQHVFHVGAVAIEGFRDVFL